MSDTEVGGLDRAGRLALASPYSRREWGLALEIMGSRADELLPTVQELSAIGWAPSAAAINLLSVAQAVADAEAEALRAHEAGECHLSEWSCSHCETAAERMGS